MTSEEKIQRVEKALQDAGYETGCIIETASGIHTIYSVEYFEPVHPHRGKSYIHTDHLLVAVTPDNDKLLILHPYETLNL